MANPLNKWVIFILFSVFSTSLTESLWSQDEEYEGEETIEPILLDLRLMGSDLVDEMVHDWLSSPIFRLERPLALTHVSAPIGLDGRFSDLVENRLFEVITANPALKIKLTHCGICRQMVAKSTPQGTLIARGIDQPEVLNDLINRIPNLLALDLNFEVEGRELVLRAVIFEPQKDQRILWAKRYSWSRSSRSLLRDAQPLLSLEQARKQQNAILEGRDQLQLVSRVSVRNFYSPIAISPLAFFEQSVEGALLPDRAYRAAFSLGFTSVRESIEGWSVGGHFASLMFRERPSLIHPDVWWFLGFHYVRVRGPDAAPFAQEQLDVDRILSTGKEPRASFVAYRLGLESHLKYRFGLMAFLEYVPLFEDREFIEQKVVLGIPYHAAGVGVLFRW